MHLQDKNEKRTSILFYTILILLAIGVPLSLWKIVSVNQYGKKQEVVKTFYTYEPKAWHYLSGAETNVSTGYGGHSIAYLTVGAGKNEYKGKFYVGIFSVDQLVYYGDMSILERGINCSDILEISKQELEDLIVLGRLAPVLKKVTSREVCQMSGDLENKTDVDGSIRQGARLAYQDQ